MQGRENERSQYEVVYYEAAKWIVRGLLMNAPHSLRKKYEPAIYPLSLGLVGIDDSLVGPGPEQLVSQEEVALAEKFIQEVLKIMPPDKGTLESMEKNINKLTIAKKYRDAVVVTARKFLKKNAGQFDFYSEDLSTITENVASRLILLDPAESELFKKPREETSHETPSDRFEKLMTPVKRDEKIFQAFETLKLNQKPTKKLEDITMDIELGAKDRLEQFFKVEEEPLESGFGRNGLFSSPTATSTTASVQKEKKEEKRVDKHEENQLILQAPYLFPGNRKKY